jgi:hypothetical protein
MQMELKPNSNKKVKQRRVGPLDRGTASGSIDRTHRTGTDRYAV